MKIVSRPEPDVIGSGDITFRMSFEELQLIATYLGITRLGQGTYKKAAFNLIKSIEDFFDDADFLTEAAEDVEMYVSQVDIDGDTVIQQFPYSEIVLEL